MNSLSLVGWKSIQPSEFESQLEMSIRNKPLNLQSVYLTNMTSDKSVKYTRWEFTRQIPFGNRIKTNHTLLNQGTDGCDQGWHYSQYGG